MNTIPESLAFYASQKTHAGRICAADSTGSITYPEMWARVLEFASRLKEEYPKGTFVLVRCTQDIDYLVSILSVETAGLTAVPVEGNAAKERILKIVEETGAKLYIGPDGAPDGCTQIRPDQVPGAGTAAGLPETENPHTVFTSRFPILPSDIAEILFTTGSTGKAKGILITHANNKAIAENIIDGVEMKADNVELIPMPLSHSHGLRTFYANLLRGGTVVLIDGIIRTKLFYNLLETYRATALDLSPAILTALVKLSRDRLGNYKDQIDYVELGSAPLSEEGKQALIRLLPDSRLYNFYGSTESGRTCTYDFNHERRGAGCIGKPARNARYLFVDEKRQPVKADRDNPGLIATGGAQNMPGYYNEPELTQSIMQDGFIYTTDLGFQDEDGYIYCLGRQDFVINRGGIKIGPEEIEEAAGRFPAVADCACVPAKDDVQGQVPVLFVAPVQEETLSASGLMEYLKDHLDVSRLPKRIEVTDRIPRAENGKILRAELIRRLQ